MHRTTISLTDEDYQFAIENDLEISRIIRMHIEQIRAIGDKTANENKALRANIEGLRKLLSDRVEFLEKTNQMEDFFEWLKKK